MADLLREVLEASARLGAPPESCRALDEVEASEVVASTKHRFVESEKAVWWWTCFRQPATSACVEQAWRLLPDLVPDAAEFVWLITEQDDDGRHNVFETTTAWASRLLGECYAFEYYLVAKDFSWLVGENHHDVLFAIGNAVEMKLAECMAKTTVKRGTFLYDGSVECDIRIVSSQTRFGTGDDGDPDDIREDADVLAFYVEYGSTTQRGVFASAGGGYRSVVEAVAAAEKALGSGSSLRWNDVA